MTARIAKGKLPVDRGNSFTVDILPDALGRQSIPASQVDIGLYGENVCRRMVNELMASRGISRTVGYQTFWRWRKLAEWQEPPYEKRQVKVFALFGYYVTKEEGGGLGLSARAALSMAMEKVFGDSEND